MLNQGGVGRYVEDVTFQKTGGQPLAENNGMTMARAKGVAFARTM
jgi:hypothetical protein